MSQGHHDKKRNAAKFATTHWSVVLAAGRDSTAVSQAALVRLCETYWYPLYAYVRRKGHQSSDARDLVQEFFARLLESDFVRAADRERGRFRSFLITLLKRFLVDEWQRAGAEKRGGGRCVLSLDFEYGENRFHLEPSHDWTPERIYERRWALTLLDQVLERLRRDYDKQGKVEFFDRVKVFLTGVSDAPPYSQIAEDLAMTEGAVKVAVHRLRGRYRELLKEEVAHTVSSADDVYNELGHLLSALRGESTRG